LLLQVVQIRGVCFGLNASHRMHLLLNLLLHVVQIRGMWAGPKALQRTHLLLCLLLHVVQIRGTWLAPKLLQRMHLWAASADSDRGGSPPTPRTPAHASSATAINRRTAGTFQGTAILLHEKQSLHPDGWCHRTLSAVFSRRQAGAADAITPRP
jgi:hypothetical protein